MPQKTVVFIALEIAVLIVFAVGITGNILFWLNSSAHRDRSLVARIRLVLTKALARQALQDILLDWLVQRRLFRLSKLRWLMHLCFFWGIVTLFFVGSVGLMLAERGLLPITKDDPWFAFVNDFAGGALLFAVAIAIYRRFVRKEPHLHTEPEDIAVAALLTFIVISGYGLEAARLIAREVPGEIARYSFIGYPLSLALRLLQLDWQNVETLAWWAHVATGMAFVAYLPYSKLLHLIAGPITVIANTAESAVHHSLSSKQLIELDACSRCGECSRWCQAYAERPHDYVAPSIRLRAFRAAYKATFAPPLLGRLLGGIQPGDERLRDMAGGAYRCTLCARCVAVCPSKIDLRSLWISTRKILVDQGLQPAGLNTARAAIVEQHNVVNYPNEERALWVDYMVEAPDDAYQREKADIVYFVGCIASFSPAVQSIPSAFVQLLSRAELNFTILGEKEHCCGFPLLAAGMHSELNTLMQHNIAVVRETGAKTVVFTCPSCYNTWFREYKPHIPDIELVHSTQLIRDILHEGRLKLGDLRQTVTYHDPCDLGRNSGIYDPPRDALRSIPGIKFLEINHNREKGLCCGGGGDLEISDPALANAEAASTLTAFEKTGADILVTACQQCKRILQTAKERKGSYMAVMDLAELVLQAVESGTTAAMHERESAGTAKGV